MRFYVTVIEEPRVNFILILKNGINQEKTGLKFLKIGNGPSFLLFKINKCLFYIFKGFVNVLFFRPLKSSDKKTSRILKKIFIFFSRVKWGFKGGLIIMQCIVL